MHKVKLAWSTVIATMPNLKIFGMPQKLMPTRNDVSVVTVGHAKRPPTAFLKVANSSQAAQGLIYQKNILQMLRDNGRLQNWPYLPTQLASSQEKTSQTFLLEKVVKGQNLHIHLQNKITRDRLLQKAVNVIDGFHGKTADIHLITAATLTTWVDEPINFIHDTLNPRTLGRQLPKLEYLRTRLKKALIDKELPQSWVHGNYTPSNIMVQHGNISGIIDWEMARPYALPHIDYLHLFLTAKMTASGQNLGELICSFLRRKTYWTKEELTIFSSANVPQLGDFIDGETLLLLTWMQSISTSLGQSTHYAEDASWVKKNISAVLHLLPKN